MVLREEEGSGRTPPLREALGCLATWKVSSGQGWWDGADDGHHSEVSGQGGGRPAFWVRPLGRAPATHASGGAPSHGATRAWGLWLQTQDSAPSDSAPACCRQEPSQHPDRIRVRAVPSPGRSLQEGGRSRGRRQIDDPAKRLPVALADRGGCPGWGAWELLKPGETLPEARGFHASRLCTKLAPETRGAF